MSNTLKKVLAALVACLMVLSLAACAGGTTTSTASKTEQTSSAAGSKDEETYYNKTGFPIAKELITITGAGPDTNNGRAWKETLMCQDWVTKFNIQIEDTTYTGDVWKTQLANMLASDSLPDLILNAGLSEADAQKYGSQGFLLNFAEYKDLMPEMYKRFEANKAYELFLSDEKGAIYGLSWLLDTRHEALNRVYISQKWLDNLDLEMPKTTEDLYNVLKAFKEKDANGNGDPNDEIPFALCDKYGAHYSYRMLLEAFGINTKDPSLPLVVNDGKVEYAGISENYKAYLKYMRTLYKDGLINEGAFVDTADELKAKAAYDLDAVGMINEAPFLSRGTEISKDADMAWIGGLTSELNDVQYVGISTGVQSDIKTIVSADSKYKEALVRLIDYYFSEEGYVDGISGPYGVSWEYVEDEIIGQKIRKFLRPEEGFKSDEDFRANYAIINGAFTLYQTYEFIGRGNMYKLTDEQLQSEAVLNQYGWAAQTEYGMRREGNVMVYDFYPVMSYTEEESAERSQLVTDIQEYMGAVLAQFVTGDKEVDALWDEYVSNLKSYGLENLLKIEQQAYERYSANM